MPAARLGLRPDGTYSVPTSVSVTLITVCTLSMVASMFMSFTYIKWKRLRRHPANLFMSRNVCDMLFTGLVAASHLYQLFVDPSGETTDSTDGCGYFSFFTELSNLASEWLLLCLALDLVISITNPFTDYRRNTRFYHAASFLLAIVPSTIMVTAQYQGRPLYDRNNYLAICWVPKFGASLAYWIFSGSPLVVVYLFSTVALLYSARRLQQGLPETFSARIDMFRYTMRTLVAFLLYWVLVGAIVTIIYFTADGDPPTSLTLLLAISIGSRGIVTCTAWLLT